MIRFDSAVAVVVVVACRLFLLVASVEEAGPEAQFDGLRRQSSMKTYRKYLASSLRLWIHYLDLER